MANKRSRSQPRERLSPTNTVSDYSDDFIESLKLPQLPEQIPARLEEAIRKRVSALLYTLKEAKKERYVGTLEIRLVRDAHRAVLTAYELGITDSEVHYASFRQLVEELGYERTDVGFRKREEGF